MTFRTSEPMELSHRCLMPTSVDVALFAAGTLYWTCEDCGAVYVVELDRSPEISWLRDHSSSVTYTDANGMERDHYTREVYSLVTGRARTVYKIGGILGLDYRDVMGLEVTKDFPEEELARLGETRASSPTLAEILETVEARRAVAEEEAKQSKKTRWWKR